ncbi:DNA primase [bacterium]|jgi:DNA primase|nr:DNA primase [bacterium]MBT4649026.1 DNA primase [bacterium]
MDPVEEIKAKLDIADVVGSYIALNPLGDNLKARCPFHNEKTASFMVSKTKQIWHCFGCNKGGDVISFVQEYEGLSFPETLKILADKANVVLPTFKSGTKKDYSNLYEINHLAVEFYQNKLNTKAEVSDKVLAYLKKRQISESSIQKWQLGLSGEDWDELSVYLRGKGFSDQVIFQAGLSLKKKSGSGYIDRFRKRLMFPIYDQQGQPVAFTSRTLAGIVYQEEEMGGKYVNSPQTSVYDKSKILYGWHLSREEIRRQKYLIIVEGNMDVIAVHQAGSINTVAVSGTALTDDHIHLIKRYTDNVILAFDGDAAGSRAAFRGITAGWKNELNLKILLLPKGKDPADLVSEDKNLWTKAIKDSLPVMDYYIKRVLAGVDLNRADHKKIAVNKLLPIIKFLKSNIEQTHYLQILADKLNLPIQVLQQDLESATSFLESKEESRPQSEAVKNKVLSLSEQILSLAFYRDNYLEKVVADIEPEIFEDTLQALYKKVIIYYTKHQFLKDFLDKGDLEDTEKETWIKLSLSAEKDYESFTDQELANHFQALLANFKKQHLAQQRQSLIQQLKQAELANDANQQDKLMHQINLLNKEVHKL